MFAGWRAAAGRPAPPPEHASRRLAYTTSCRLQRLPERTGVERFVPPGFVPSAPDRCRYEGIPQGFRRGRRRRWQGRRSRAFSLLKEVMSVAHSAAAVPAPTSGDRLSVSHSGCQEVRRRIRSLLDVGSRGRELADGGATSPASSSGSRAATKRCLSPPGTDRGRTSGTGTAVALHIGALRVSAGS